MKNARPIFIVKVPFDLYDKMTEEHIKQWKYNLHESLNGEYNVVISSSKLNFEILK